MRVRVCMCLSVCLRDHEHCGKEKLRTLSTYNVSLISILLQLILRTNLKFSWSVDRSPQALLATVVPVSIKINTVYLEVTIGCTKRRSYLLSGLPWQCYLSSGRSPSTPSCTEIKAGCSSYLLPLCEFMNWTGITLHLLWLPTNSLL
jgi:hypothetical protein